MKTSKYILAALSAIVYCVPAQAQFYLDGFNSYNDGGMVAYYDNPGIVSASGNYTAVSAALTVHGGTTLQVDGPYTASGGSVDSFTGDGASVWPPMDAPKTISGTTGPSFDIAKFMNGFMQPVTITNAQGINIATRLDFASGITSTVRSNTSTGAIHFADGATYTATAPGDAQHVDGYVSKAGNDAFTYPVGSGSDMRTLSISAPASVTDEYSVAWIAGNPGASGDPSNGNAMHPTTAVSGPIMSVSTAGQWDWIPVSGTGAGLTITVSIPNPGGLGATAADLRLVGWNGTSWVDLSGGPNASGTTEGSTLSGTMIPGIQAIGIGSVSVALPVTFSSFEAQKQGCTALISWATDAEQNSRYFAVERSNDGSHFTAIAQVAAAGNSSSRLYYSYTDSKPLAGVNQYRITQVSADGRSSSTTVKSLTFDCGKAQVQVYPNPTSGRVSIDLPAGYEQAEISVYTTLGRVINLPATGKAGHSGVHTLDFSSLAQGQYLIRVANGTDVHTFKVIYQH